MDKKMDIRIGTIGFYSIIEGYIGIPSTLNQLSTSNLGNTKPHEPLTSLREHKHAPGLRYLQGLGFRGIHWTEIQ